MLRETAKLVTGDVISAKSTWKIVRINPEDVSRDINFQGQVLIVESHDYDEGSFLPQLSDIWRSGESRQSQELEQIRQGYNVLSVGKPFVITHSPNGSVSDIPRHLYNPVKDPSAYRHLTFQASACGRDGSISKSTDGRFDDKIRILFYGRTSQTPNGLCVDDKCPHIEPRRLITTLG